MIHAVDPRQNRLFDPFDGVISPVGRRIIAKGWQGILRHVLLEVMPVAKLGQHFSDSLGAPTKELYSMAGLVFLADFFGWTAHDAVEAYIFRSDVQYALNLEPGAGLLAHRRTLPEAVSRGRPRCKRLRRGHHPTHQNPRSRRLPAAA